MDSDTLFNVKGKVVLITGGAKGIGRMIAEGFASNGAKVYITGRDAPACHKAVSDLTPLAARLNSSVHALPADLQSYAACEDLAAELKRLEPGGLHVLVNNAGATWGASVDEYPDSAWTKVLTLNLQRVFTLTQLLLPLLETASSPKSDPARIINIGSVDGLRVPVVANYAYAASKAGLHHLSRALARDLGERGISSNTLACGPFLTKMTRQTLAVAGDSVREGVPAGRIGKGEDVAGACLFLASKAGAFVNGATITLDGGMSLVAKL